MTDFMESGKSIHKAEVGKAMEKVDYDDPVCVIFTSVMIKKRYLLKLRKQVTGIFKVDLLRVTFGM